MRRIAQPGSFPEIVPGEWYGFDIPGHQKGKQRPRARRMGLKGIQLYAPAQTIVEEAWVRACCVEAIGNPFLIGPVEVAIDVTVEIPQGWAWKKRLAASRGEFYPTSKPDTDNIAKLQFDALNGILWHDDSQVFRHTVQKLYGERPHAVFMFRWLGPPPGYNGRPRKGAKAQMHPVEADMLRLGLVD